MCTDVYTHITGVSTESMDVYGSMYTHISTKGTGAHRGTSTDVYMVNKVVQGRTNVHGEYGRYEPKQEIGKDAVGKVRKGISYTDNLLPGL